MKPHESPRMKKKNQFVAIRAIRGLCGIGVLHTCSCIDIHFQSFNVLIDDLT